MTLTDIVLGGVALSMDAAAIGMSDGMSEAKAKMRRVALIGGLFGLFQALLTLFGYYLTKAVGAVAEWDFSSLAGVFAFALLALIGGKTLLDGIKEARERKSGEAHEVKEKRIPFHTLVLQAIATAIDAFAFGISMRMGELSSGLSLRAPVCGLIIGVITFFLVCVGVLIGKKAGDKLADKAEIVGGVVLLLIAFKCLLF